ncbi:unnamed protein product [Cochlearia groenlandica]
MASKTLTNFFLLILFLDLVSLSVASLTPISSAVEILSDAGYFSMGLTLNLANQDLNLEDWEELTIFAPSDKAFSSIYGQPSLLDIKYQLSPTRIPGEIIRNLPIAAKIPTLRSNSSHSVTNSSRSGGKPSLNNVLIDDSPLFDDGFVVIYGSDEFFTATISDPILNSSSSTSSSSSSSSIPEDPISSPDSIPITSSANRFNIFESASRLLMSRGFVIMATFLALQLDTFSNDTKLTIFAPLDEAIPNLAARFSDYVSVFKGHVINRFLTWKDLEELAWEDSIMESVLKGYEIEVSWERDALLLNGVPLVYPDLFVNDWIVVHGLNQLIKPKANPVKPGQEEGEEDYVHGEYSSELGDYGLH